MAVIAEPITKPVSRFLLDRLSYRMGGEQYSPYRLEIGRFTSFYLPEVGTVDGAEGALVLEDGLSIGGAVGAQFGVRAAARLRGEQLRLLMAILVLAGGIVAASGQWQSATIIGGRIEYLGVKESDRVKILTPLDSPYGAGIGLLHIDGLPPEQLVPWLFDKHKIVSTVIVHPEFNGVRVTPNVYTTTQEVDLFAEKVLEAIQMAWIEEAK